MSDIVERLRHPKATQAEMEAAAEIERLRELLKDVDDGLDEYWVTTEEGTAWICARHEALGENHD